MTISVDWMAYQSGLRLKRKEQKRYIFCAIRRKYLVLQPEELLRQLVLSHLIENGHCNRNRLHVERGLTVNRRYRRLDIIAYDEAVQPWLLVECKAPHVPLTQAAFDQIATYNLALKVPYLLVTNGRQTCCCAMDYEAQSYAYLAAIPQQGS